MCCCPGKRLFKFTKYYFEAIVGSREFEKNLEVQKRVIGPNLTKLSLDLDL